MTDIPTLAHELNSLAESYAIGELQDLRKEIKNFSRRPGNTIFSVRTIQEYYAFHHGGRTELQFNIGYSGHGGFRHGVGFSFETSHTLPDIDVLRPKVKRFNDFLKLYPDTYSHLLMYHVDQDDVRSEDYSPCPIPSELIRNGTFVFLGHLTPGKKVDPNQILADFDELLPLYKYVESVGNTPPVIVLEPKPFEFVSGCKVKKLKTTATRKSDPVDVSLRHNALQLALYKTLCKEYGAKNVGTELSTGNGTRVDVVVQRPKGFWFYEIKTYDSSRACIREARGQLLEYSHWPTGLAASQLIVVGESKLDKEGQEYLEKLRSQFTIPINYRQVGLMTT